MSERYIVRIIVEKVDFNDKFSRVNDYLGEVYGTELSVSFRELDDAIEHAEYLAMGNESVSPS